MKSKIENIFIFLYFIKLFFAVASSVLVFHLYTKESENKIEFSFFALQFYKKSEKRNVGEKCSTLSKN